MSSVIEKEILAKIDVGFVPADDKVWYTKYMVKKWKHSPQSYQAAQSYIKDFYNTVDKPICELTFDDIDEYIEHVDASGKKRQSKFVYATSVHKYLKHVAYELNRRGAKIVNLFPPELEFSFDSVLEDIEGAEDDVIPQDVMERILDAARARSMWEFVFVLLLKHCGMRISECKTLKVKNIHLEERYLVTAVVHGARKTNKDGQHPAVYFYPQYVANQIRQYLRLLPQGEEWAFPSPGRLPKSKVGYVTNVQLLIQRYADMVDFPLRSHSFRRTINTLRKKMGCIPEDRAFFLNQKVTMNAERYVKMSPAERRALFDRWNPY